LNLPTSGHRPLAIACSNSGQKLTVGYNIMYTSNDYGLTWSQSNTTLRNIVHIVMDYDIGQYQVATSISALYSSSDFGKTWAYRLQLEFRNPSAMYTMFTKKRIFIHQGPGYPFYGSTDLGVTWSALPWSYSNWLGYYLTADTTGKYLTRSVCCCYGVPEYSHDYEILGTRLRLMGVATTNWFLTDLALM